MKKTELHDMVLETVDELLHEAELSTGDNDFTIKVDVNRNPTKKGIKIQLIPKGDTVLIDPDEKIDVNEKVQSAMNAKLRKFDLQVNVDPDIRQATDNPNVLGYYIPLSQIKNLIVKALEPENKGEE
jgi:hypothetical protein